MAAFVIGAPDCSATKQKALEDARSMQASIVRECNGIGREPPPYMFLELIGKGSFGRVYKASTIGAASRKLVAIKVISIEAGDSASPGTADTFGDIMKEINALKLLSTKGARNVNTIIDALLVGQSMWMITEYCAGGSVASLMRPTGCLPERWIIPILREVAEAIYWVHKQGIIHRDIKCANVLVTDAGSVQLCDFGVAAVVESTFDKRTTVTGTLQWMAPELFDSTVSYGTEVDIWAFGSMAYEVASGLPPNATADVNILDFSAHLKQNCPRLEGNHYSSLLKDFVSRCMVVDPAQRPIISTVQKHPYILNTGDDYPTSSLSKLVKAYKLWETQGGSRHSLFAQGGAQASTDRHSSVDNEEWNFSTMDGSEETITGVVDVEVIRDAYHPDTSFQPPASGSRRRRRPPPDIKALVAPLEKAFSPNTISNYHDNVRAFYDKTYIPPTSDLPSRDDNSIDLTLRASLIDLDASLASYDKTYSPPASDFHFRNNSSDLTLRDSLIDLDASPHDYEKSYSPRASNSHLRARSNDLALRASLIDLDASLNTCDLLQFEDVEVLRAILRAFSDDIADLDRRKTRDWTFPAATKPPVSVDSKSAWPPPPSSPPPPPPPPPPRVDDSEDEDPRISIPDLARLYLAANRAANRPSTPDPIAPSRMPSNRDSTLSLIDLDDGLPSIVVGDIQSPTATTTAPTSPCYDVRSTSFDSEPPTLRVPSTAKDREPSLYVTSDVYHLYSAPAKAPQVHSIQRVPSSSSLSSLSSSSDDRVRRDSGTPRAAAAATGPGAAVGLTALSLPPAPTSPKAAQGGVSSRDEVRAELRRMRASLAAHILKRFPVRQGEKYPSE